MCNNKYFRVVGTRSRLPAPMIEISTLARTYLHSGAGPAERDLTHGSFVILLICAERRKFKRLQHIRNTICSTNIPTKSINNELCRHDKVYINYKSTVHITEGAFFSLFMHFYTARCIIMYVYTYMGRKTQSSFAKNYPGRISTRNKLKTFIRLR